jgi:hypothetical protein
MLYLEERGDTLRRGGAGDVEGRETGLAALLVDVGAVVDEQAHDVRQVVLGGDVERVQAVAVLEADVLGSFLLGQQGLEGADLPLADVRLDGRRELVAGHLHVAVEEHELHVQLALHRLALLAHQREPLVHRHAVAHVVQLEHHLAERRVPQHLLAVQRYHHRLVLLVHVTAHQHGSRRPTASVSCHCCGRGGGQVGGRGYKILLPSFQLGSDSFLMTLDL